MDPPRGMAESAGSSRHFFTISGLMSPLLGLLVHIPDAFAFRKNAMKVSFTVTGVARGKPL